MARTVGKKKVIDVVEKPPIENIIRPIQKFFRIEASSGIILLCATIAALLWANSGLGYLYKDFWALHVRLGIGTFNLEKTLLEWINDGLMTIFFFVVGLEIKKEALLGEIAELKKALLPMFAAIGGMIFPALIFIAFNYDKGSLSGWGIPMATDIAFSLGIITILGSRVPHGVKVFLTAFAIIDDLGAIVIIALFYTSQLELNYILLAMLLIVLLIVCNKLHIRMPAVYIIVGVFLWFAFLKSGIHATISGVLLALTIPTRSRINAGRFVSDNRSILNKLDKLTEDYSKVPVSSAFNYHVYEMESSCEKILPPAHRLEHNLHTFVAFFIMPLFALANSGFIIESSFLTLFDSPVIIGIVAGLFGGKIIGVYLFSRLSVKLMISNLPENVKWKHILGVAALGGVGFTMSLFISTLAFGGTPYMTEAKMGIFMGSLISGVTGYLILRMKK